MANTKKEGEVTRDTQEVIINFMTDDDCQSQNSIGR